MEALGLPDTMVVGTDVRDREAIGEAVRAAEERFGPTDCLFNNAGIARLGDIRQQDPMDWDYRANKMRIGGGISADHVADSILFAFSMPQNVLIQEICITPTRQEH